MPNEQQDKPELMFDPALTERFKETLLKSVEHLKHSIETLDLTKLASLEHAMTQVVELDDNIALRIGYVERTMNEYERLTALASAQKGRTGQRDVTSIREAVRTDTHKEIE